MANQVPDRDRSFETHFTVMPDQTNYMLPMIFGGAFASQLDLCAASHITKILAYCDPTGPTSAVTHKMLITFHAAAFMGDLVRITSQVKEIRRKAISMEITAYRQTRSFRHSSDGEQADALLVTSEFVFVTKRDGNFVVHNLE